MDWRYITIPGEVRYRATSVEAAAIFYWGSVDSQVPWLGRPSDVVLAPLSPRRVTGGGEVITWGSLRGSWDGGGWGGTSRGPAVTGLDRGTRQPAL